MNSLYISGLMYCFFSTPVFQFDIYTGRFHMAFFIFHDN